MGLPESFWVALKQGDRFLGKGPRVRGVKDPSEMLKDKKALKEIMGTSMI